MDAAGLQKLLASALSGTGGPGGATGQLDLAGLQKLLAGVMGQAGGPGNQTAAGDTLHEGMSRGLIGQARTAMKRGNLGDTLNILQRLAKGASQDDPASSAALRMAVRMEALTKNLAARAEWAKRTGDHVAHARSLMKLSSAVGDSEQGRRARAWLVSAGMDSALAGAVREAGAQEIVADLTRVARAAARISATNGGVIVTDVSRRTDPLTDDIARTPPGERLRLLAAARRQLERFSDTPTGKRILGQLADLEAGKPLRPATRPTRRDNWRSLRID